MSAGRLIIVSVFFLQSCMLWRSYDRKPFVVQTQSLGRQHGVLTVNSRKVELAGDWLFRRDRLAALDEQLQNQQPSMLLLQQVLQKKANWSEYDFQILRAGALAGYNFTGVIVREDADKLEQESVGFAVDPSFGILTRSKRIESLKDWPVIYSVVSYEGHAVLLVNSSAPLPGLENRFHEKPYSELAKQVRLLQSALGVCVERYIVGGFFPPVMGGEAIQVFVEGLEGVDVAADKCRQDVGCLTLDPQNPLGSLEASTEANHVRANPESGRLDRIILPNSASIEDLGRVSDKRVKASPYQAALGFSELCATPNFGWSASVQFQICK